MPEHIHQPRPDTGDNGGITQVLPLPVTVLAAEPSEQHQIGLTLQASSHSECANDRGPGRRGTLEDGEGQTERSPLLGDRDCSLEDDGKASSGLPFLEGMSSARFRLIFCQLLVGMFVSCFDGTIMASSHPVITSYFGAANMASWLSTSFQLATVAVQPVLGRLSDATGRRPLLIAALALLLVSTLGCTVAASIQQFIIARTIGGLGAGISMSVTAIIISDLVPLEVRGTYQAYLNLVYGGGTTLGAALGGVMAEKLGWRWEFGVQLPLLFLLFLLSMVSIPRGLGVQDSKKTVREALADFDILGSTLLIVFLSLLILGLNFGGNYLPWSHPFVVTALTLCGLLLPVIIWQETRAKSPVIPLKFCIRGPHANLLHSNFITCVLANGLTFNLPLFFQAVLLTNATTSGLRLAFPTVVSSLFGAFTGLAITRTRRIKWPVMTGTTLILLGTIALVFMGRHLPDIMYHLVLVPTSIGQGLAFPGTFIALLASSEQAEQAVITSVLMLWRSVGMVLGVALSSLAVQNGLVYYLDKFVAGERREEIIELARSDIEAIVKMPEPYREQVVDSYAAALRVTFTCGAGLALVCVLILVPMRTKGLPSRK